MTSLTKPEAEVDFIHLARTIWDGRILMGKLILLSVVIGFFVAILIPNQFTASSTMVPQITDPKSSIGGLSGMSGLSGLAAMAGVNINTGTGSDLSPRTYASIISSVPFQLELMKTRLNFEKPDTSVTLYDYFTKIKFANPLVKFTVGLPHQIILAIKGEPNQRFTSNAANPLYALTEKQIEVQRIIERQVGIFINEKDGNVSINCTLSEAYASAQLAHSTQLLLQKYITEFKIEKAKVNLDFIQQRYDEARKNYQSAQQQLAIFRDRNRNVSTAVAKTEEERLTAEYTLITGVYSELAKKLEQAKITVKEETPVFTIINPVSVPSEKSSPNRPLILAIAAFIGFVLSMIWILGKDFMVEIVTKWKKNDQ